MTLPADPPPSAGRAGPDDWRRNVADEMFRIDPAYATAAQRFLDCGQKIVAVLTCPVNPNHKSRPLPDHCDNRICPTCAGRERDRLLDRYVDAVQAVIDAHARAGYRTRHIVLTTNIHPCDPDAKPRYETARTAIEPTFRACICPRRDGESVHDWDARWRAMKHKIGVLICDESGEDGNRMHFHVTLFGPFIPQAVLSVNWEKLTGFPIVYITLKDGAAAIRETLKYVTKFVIDGQIAQPRVLAAIFDLLHGKRRVRSYGLFYNLPDPFSVVPEPTCQCPQCDAQAEPQPLRKWLDTVRRWNEAGRYLDELGDLVDEVIVTLAHACRQSNHQAEARELWAAIFDDFRDTPNWQTFGLQMSADSSPPIPSLESRGISRSEGAE